MHVERKLRDLQLAEKVEKIAEKDVELAEKVVRSLEDREARIFGLVVLHNITENMEYLKNAIETAETDEELLLIIERSKTPLPEIAEMINSPYRRDIAYCIILEKTGDMNFSSKISDARLLSASLKRLALKKLYPENLRIARIIPDPYYRALALMELAEREKVDLKDEIVSTVGQVKNSAMKRRLEEMLEKKY